MRLIIPAAVLLICVIVKVKCGKNSLCKNQKTLRLPEYTRVKRAKYYSYPPRFYRKPPMAYPVKGPFSYTPPPSYKDEEHQYPAQSSKVSIFKRHNEGLDDEDINNIVKHLSKKDLEKIIESASGKYTDDAEYRDDYTGGPGNKKPEHIFKDTLQEIEDDSKFLLNNPNIDNAKEASQPKIVYVDTQRNAYNNAAVQNTRQNNIIYVNRDENKNFPNYVETPNYLQKRPIVQTSIQNYNQQDHSYPGPFQNIRNKQFPTEDNKNNYQITYVTPHNPSFEEIVKDDNIFTDSGIMQEETLPKPANLRKEYEAAYSNKAPTVVKSSSYQLENFGDLPLMNYHNSKLHSVSSYNVPHYTVTSNAKTNSSPTQSFRSSAPPLEPAPSRSAAQEQSDAHLKAIKIWTHKSRGTAYTLHNDGSLTLEKPNRPRATNVPS